MSTIRLYQVDFEPRDNFYIEDIESYLNTLPSTSKRFNTDKGNYLQLSMNIELKLPLTQDKQIMNEANYAVIEQDSTRFYYFVTGARWIAKKTVSLSLTLDTVQTFYDKLRWSDRTQITREHRNRLIRLNKNTFLRNIDRYSESMNPALIQKKREEKIFDEIGSKWYLVYMSNPATTQDVTGNPMFMGLLATTSYTVYNATSGADVTINIADYRSDKLIYVTDSSIGTGAYISLTRSNGNELRRISLDEVNGNKTLRAFGFNCDVVSSQESRKLWYTGDTYPYSFEEGNWGQIVGDNEADKIVFHNIRSFHVISRTDYNKGITNLDKLDALPVVAINAGTLPAVSTTPYKSFDNSNSRLSKIIELPYCPVNVTKNSDGTYTFTDCSFNYGYNILQINRDTLSRTIKTDNRIQDLLYVTLTEPSATDAPNIDLESKLYNSEFYDYSYYYDTDKLKIRLEDISTDKLTAAFSIINATTTTMNSDKQFKIAPVNCSYNEYQPYELYINSSRSTEKMILNDSYADYIKNGYNYDQWSNKRAQTLATINSVISGIQAAAGFGGAVAAPISAGISGARLAKKLSGRLDTINYIMSERDQYHRDIADPSVRAGIKVQERKVLRDINKYIPDIDSQAGDLATQIADAKSSVSKSVTGIGSLVLGQGISAANSMANSIDSIESNKRAFENSINSRANTPISASGSVPVDLFDNYSGNKLTRFEYGLRDDDRTNIWKTFRFMGYSHPVQEVPDFNSRIYSNFVQCTPAFDNGTTEVYKVFLDDIVQRFQAGVTIKHKYNNKYDLHDQYENYERFVLEDNK